MTPDLSISCWHFATPSLPAERLDSTAGRIGIRSLNFIGSFLIFRKVHLPCWRKEFWRTSTNSSCFRCVQEWMENGSTPNLISTMLTLKAWNYLHFILQWKILGLLPEEKISMSLVIQLMWPFGWRLGGQTAPFTGARKEFARYDRQLLTWCILAFFLCY